MSAYILDIGKRLHYVYQREKRGFGHAVYQAAQFARNEPVMLLLGDTIYRSDSNKPCALQLIEEYERYNTLMVSIHKIPPGRCESLWHPARHLGRQGAQRAQRRRDV